MTARWQIEERRYGEHAVTLTNSAGERLHGCQYTVYPVDEPPLVEVPSLNIRWFLHVWEEKGWTVEVVSE